MNGKLVYYAADEEHWIAFSPDGKFVQEGIARGSGILYRGIKQGVDLEYIIDGNTLKERIILNSYTGISSFSFEVIYEGIALNKQADGTIWATDTITGQRLFILRKPTAVDANDNFTDMITMDIVRDVASERIVLTIDSTWLKAAAYPVVLILPSSLRWNIKIQIIYLMHMYPADIQPLTMAQTVIYTQGIFQDTIQ